LDHTHQRMLLITASQSPTWPVAIIGCSASWPIRQLTCSCNSLLLGPTVPTSVPRCLCSPAVGVIILNVEVQKFLVAQL